MHSGAVRRRFGETRTPHHLITCVASSPRTGRPQWRSPGGSAESREGCCGGWAAAPLAGVTVRAAVSALTSAAEWQSGTMAPPAPTGPSSVDTGAATIFNHFPHINDLPFQKSQKVFRNYVIYTYRMFQEARCKGLVGPFVVDIYN